jgi:hypothetical protein
VPREELMKGINTIMKGLNIAIVSGLFVDQNVEITSATVRRYFIEHAKSLAAVVRGISAALLRVRRYLNAAQE